ncbi:DUF6713 family protein [Pseudomonas sp. B8(2017)]|uniref:DUF6713 family protein n=1 Tax=Pseudomonas sp. B8(2017) TaxID=1981711 RepID=UPI000A1E4225|nr:DUF6713 family protein [Pseudomonas sp. B8(2017)]
MERSYFVTMLALILHQIDAAYWHEWEMFFLPGGVQGFLLFNILAIPVLLVGYRSVLLGKVNAVFFAKVCAGLGLITFLIHAGFGLAGYHQFHLPASISILILCLASSVWLMAGIRSSSQ